MLIAFRKQFFPGHNFRTRSLSTVCWIYDQSERRCSLAGHSRTRKQIIVICLTRPFPRFVWVLVLRNRFHVSSTFGNILTPSTAWWLTYMGPQSSTLWLLIQMKTPAATNQSITTEPSERPDSKCHTWDFMELFDWLLCDFLIDAFRFLR